MYWLQQYRYHKNFSVFTDFGELPYNAVIITNLPFTTYFTDILADLNAFFQIILITRTRVSILIVHPYSDRKRIF